MMSERVLVTAAAGGRAGQTGRHVSEILLKRGVQVRALVHSIDERSERLRRLGAEIVAGDFLDFSSMQRAVQGVSSIYFAYPVQDGLLDATAIAAAAARDARVSRLVNVVMLRSSPDAPTPRMRQNWLSEQIFDWAAVGAAHVRAAVFYENIRSLVLSSLAGEGAIQLPWGSDETVIPLVGAEDVARVAVGLLTAPVLQAGSGHRLIGSSLTLRQIIAAFGRVLDREVRYEEISDDDWRRKALARGLNAHAVEHLSQLWRFLRLAGSRTGLPAYEVTDTIKTLGGAEPKSFETFLREQLHPGELSSP